MAGYTDMEIDVIAKSHLSDDTFLDVYDLRHGSCNPAHLHLHFLGRCSIEQFGDRRTHLPNTVEENDWGRAKGSPIVGGRIVCEQCNRNADESKCGGNCIAEMMPSVGFDSCAFNIRCDGADVAREENLNHDHTDKDSESVGLRELVRCADFRNAFC